MHRHASIPPLPRNRRPSFALLRASLSLSLSVRFIQRAAPTVLPPLQPFPAGIGSPCLMTPRSDSPPAPEAQQHIKPSPDTPGKNPAFPYPHRAGLLVSLLALQLLLILSARSFPLTRSTSSSNLSTISIPSSSIFSPFPNRSASSCPLGTVYVYELPPVFNKDLVHGCDRLNPWASRCNALSNNGFGPQAKDLAGIVPSALLPSWHSTDQFAAELIYHRRMLAHPCRTHDPSEASAFFIPFYAGLAVGKYLWSPNSTSGDRDRVCEQLLRWTEKQNPWRTSNGWDHFMVLGRITWDFRRSREGDWGGSFLYMPGMENVTRLLIERNPWDERDVGVPYPTRFHPASAADVRAWQGFVLGRQRRTLFSFAGAARGGFKGDFRALLLGECARAGAPRCHAVDCGNRRCGNSSAETLSLFLNSTFCLQPRGDSFTRRSMFDCMLAGAIPVLFWKRSAYVQYGWYLPRGDEWSVFIDRRRVRSGAVSVQAELEKMGEEKVRRMRERVVELIPRLIYGGGEHGLGEGMEDAFDVALDGVLRRFREQRRRRGKEERVLG